MTREAGMSRRGGRQAPDLPPVAQALRRARMTHT